MSLAGNLQLLNFILRQPVRAWWLGLVEFLAAQSWGSACSNVESGASTLLFTQNNRMGVCVFKMRKMVFGALVAVSVWVLAGCGGGGSAGDGAGTIGTTDARSKYLGDWQSTCDSVGPSTYEREVITFTLRGTNQLKLEGQEFTYTTSDCSGAPTKTELYAGVVTMVGTRTDADGQVDKITYLLEGEPAAVNGIAAVRSDRLYVTLYIPGETPAVAVDDDNFPVALSSDFLTRSP
jgi:hypothetical protein